MKTERLSNLVRPHNVTVETVKRWAKDGSHPELADAIYKDPVTGQWRGNPERFHACFERYSRQSDFRETVRGVFGVHTQPEEEAVRNAEMNLLKIILGLEPDPFWMNAKFIRGELTIKIAAAFGTTRSAPWDIIVEQMQKVLEMPPAKKTAFFKLANERLATFCEGE